MPLGQGKHAEGEVAPLDTEYVPALQGCRTKARSGLAWIGEGKGRVVLRCEEGEERELTESYAAVILHVVVRATSSEQRRS